MQISKEQIQLVNEKVEVGHGSQFNFLAQTLDSKGVDVNAVLKQLADFQVAIPSWALGAGGTRFGRFSYFGEPPA